MSASLVWVTRGVGERASRQLKAGPERWKIWWRGLSASIPAGKNKPWVTATPRVCLHDVPTTLRAGCLLPNSPVTLSANITDEKGKHFVSHAHYVADDQGCVDVSVAAAVGGSYTGVFPAGLLSSLVPAPYESPLLRLYRRDPSTPWKVAVRVSEGHQPLGTQTEVLAEVELERHLMAPGVRRVPLREGRVRGTMFLPAGDGPFPAVVDMFGTAGGLMEFKSAMLASRGIASMALGYFAYEDLPATIDSFDLDYFEEAVRVLLSQPGVVPDRCGVLAVSKAVDIALSMATWLPQVKAVVCINGSPVAFRSALTYRGKTLVEGLTINMSQMKADGEGMLYPDPEFMRREIQSDNPKFIPFHSADEETYFLIVAGSDDAWSTHTHMPLTRKHMERFGRGDKLETVVYPGAGHILEPPYGALIHHSYHRYAPIVADDGSGKVPGVPLLWGGNAWDTCKAQEDLWPRMRTFITRHVQDESPWYQQQLAK